MFHPDATGGKHAASLTRRSLLMCGAACALPTSLNAADRIHFSDLIAGEAFTEKAMALAGQAVEMRGYMAPPLKPEINFFVLTALPAAICPFCDSAASWPDDIVLVQMERPIRAIAYDLLIRVTGTLELGTETDPSTGFVSRVRLRASRYARA